MFVFAWKMHYNHLSDQNISVYGRYHLADSLEWLSHTLPWKGAGRWSCVQMIKLHPPQEPSHYHQKRYLPNDFVIIQSSHWVHLARKIQGDLAVLCRLVEDRWGHVSHLSADFSFREIIPINSSCLKHWFVNIFFLISIVYNGLLGYFSAIISIYSLHYFQEEMLLSSLK